MSSAIDTLVKWAITTNGNLRKEEREEQIKKNSQLYFLISKAAAVAFGVFALCNISGGAPLSALVCVAAGYVLNFEIGPLFEKISLHHGFFKTTPDPTDKNFRSYAESCLSNSPIFRVIYT